MHVGGILGIGVKVRVGIMGGLGGLRRGDVDVVRGGLGGGIEGAGVDCWGG